MSIGPPPCSSGLRFFSGRWTATRDTKPRKLAPAGRPGSLTAELCMRGVDDVSEAAYLWENCPNHLIDSGAQA